MLTRNISLIGAAALLNKNYCILFRQLTLSARPYYNAGSTYNKLFFFFLNMSQGMAFLWRALLDCIKKSGMLRYLSE